MGRIAIEAFEDRTRAEGGHAVILLTGLKVVPNRPAFRLRPAGLDEDAELPFAWPEGELLPATAKVTGRGVEVVVGPDIVENPLLAAGAAIEIEFVDADIRGEFLWPSIQPITRPKRRSLVARAPQRDERFDAARPIERPVLGSVANPVAPPIPAGAETASPAELAPRAETIRSSASRSEPQRARKDEAPMSESSHEAAAANGSPSGSAQAAKRDSAEFVTFYPHARGGRLKAEKTARTPSTTKLEAFMPTTPGGMAAAIVAGVIALQGVLHLWNGGPGTQPLVQPTAATAIVDSAAQASLQPDALFEALVSGTTSPRGTNARDVPGARTLETAQTLLLAPDGTRDTEEGAFWLKRFLQGAFGDDRTLRALTHLGSTYAEPTGRSPDYTKARLVWEMAGAFGDPVAMCLLGVVHENGFGVVRDKKKALPWFERAKKAGGCPDVDESIARTRQ